MEHIKQESTVDCAIACLAMVTGYSYEEVLDRLPFNPFNEFEVDTVEGKTRVPYSFMADEIPVFLSLYGFNHVRLHTTNFFSAFGPQEMKERFSKGKCLLPTQDQVKFLLRRLGVPAILLIEPWLDDYVEHHAVVYDPITRKMYFDPHTEHNDNGSFYPIEECLIYQVILVPEKVNNNDNFNFIDALKRHLAISMDHISGE